MVEVAGIEDWETLDGWLRGRSPEDKVCVVHRAAMRVAPLFWNRLGEDWARKRGLTALMSLRLLLISGVARSCPTPEVAAAAAAADAAYTDAAYAGGRIELAISSFAIAVEPTTATAFATTFAVFATEATAYAAAFWPSVRMDCAALDASRDPFALPLWDGPAPEPIAAAWARTREDWAKKGGPVWAFWTQFFENALAGRPQDWPLLRDIALIPAEDWQGGPGRVHPIVEGMLEERRKPPTIPAGPMISARQIQSAVERNLAVLPPTFDGLEMMITLEVERLQSRNYRDDLEMEESKRLIGIFLGLHSAIAGLRRLLPENGAPDTRTAETMKSLLEVYGDEFRKWPRDNAVDLVDSTCRVMMVGASTSFLVLLGTPVAYAAALAGLVFGGKKLADLGKAVVAASAKT